jgi:hypothetical protein
MHCTLRTLREDLQGGHRWGRARRWGGLEAVCRAVSAAPALRSAVRLCRAGCPSVTAVAGIPVGIRSTYSAESPSPSRHVISQRARERERARERGREREGERERAHRQCLAQLCCAVPLACAVSLCRLKLTLPDRLGSSYTRPYVCVFLHSQCTVLLRSSVWRQGMVDPIHGCAVLYLPTCAYLCVKPDALLHHNHRHLPSLKMP